jgi:hypothetical protein
MSMLRLSGRMKPFSGLRVRAFFFSSQRDAWEFVGRG